MFPAIDLDLLADARENKEEAANNIWAALSHNAVYGIKSISGLVVTFYGGNIDVAGTPTPIASQALTLDNNTTVYVYSTSAGVFTKTTSMPSGWPGPLAASAVAMYQFVTSGGVIDDDASINYVLGVSRAGDTGATGPVGSNGTDLFVARKRLMQSVGNGSTEVHIEGFQSWSQLTVVARSVATTSFRESVPYGALETSTTAGNSVQHYHSQALVYRGDASGRGGFTAGFRFCFESANSPANCRCFIGLLAPVTIGNVEPDTLVNVVGIAAKAGQSNLSWMQNDGSGTATMTTIVSDDSPTVNFPARVTNNVYELVIRAVANGSSIELTLTNCDTGVSASTVLSTNLPVNTVFLSPAFWVNNGSSAAKAAMGIMQATLESRY